MTTRRIRVYGTPAPQGSKRHVGHGVMVESSKKVRPWRAAVTAEAAQHEPVHGPVYIKVEFYLPRPRGHYRTGRNAHLLRASAPPHHAVKPDLDKLVRSTLDALTDAGLIDDDARVYSLTARKRYADDAERPGALITIGREETA